MGERAVGRGRLTFRRLSGLDRSGPPPSATLRGQPLRPWTLPNLIGFTRLALIPVFLVLARRDADGDGVAGIAVLLFAVIAWSDYLDGIAARVSGQYSRLGALLDPVVDRLLVLAGVAVCLRFALLPRWLLGVLVAREVAMLVLGRLALARGMALSINWPGRLAVWPVMAAVFAGLVGWRTTGAVLLAVGVALSLLATALYLRRASGKPSTSA
ncbi:MAG: CDP-alcohol phosphatidyltransferase family protein [Actinomycetota bacterium]|nr:CDP-alcohol phosphatidyltransferase family protein [Actinomycetota bacterium]